MRYAVTYTVRVYGRDMSMRRTFDSLINHAWVPRVGYIAAASRA